MVQATLINFFIWITSLDNYDQELRVPPLALLKTFTIYLLILSANFSFCFEINLFKEAIKLQIKRIL